MDKSTPTFWLNRHLTMHYGGLPEDHAVQKDGFSLWID